MVSLNPALSGKLDRTIGIARPTVADPEGDNIVYGVRREGELVKKWQTYGHEVAGNMIPLRLDLGLNAEFLPVEGIFPASTDLFFETEAGTNSDIRSLLFIRARTHSIIRRRLPPMDKQRNFPTPTIWNMCRA